MINTSAIVIRIIITAKAPYNVSTNLKTNRSKHWCRYKWRQDFHDEILIRKAHSSNQNSHEGHTISCHKHKIWIHVLVFCQAWCSTWEQSGLSNVLSFCASHSPGLSFCASNFHITVICHIITNLESSVIGIIFLPACTLISLMLHAYVQSKYQNLD